METNERIDMMDTAMETIDTAVDFIADGTKDVCKVYVLGALLIGAGVTIAAQNAWKYGIKPCIEKLKAKKAKEEEEELEKYIKVEIEEEPKEGNDEK